MIIEFTSYYQIPFPQTYWAKSRHFQMSEFGTTFTYGHGDNIEHFPDLNVTIFLYSDRVVISGYLQT